MDTLDKIEDAFQTFQKGQIYRLVIDDTEKQLIDKALKYSSGNQLIASRVLGLNRNTLRSKIKKYNICIKQYQ